MQGHGNAPTRDDLLLWLNDRLGKSVHVSVEVEKGDLSVTVLEAEGELRNWRVSAPEQEGYPRPDLIGYYAVGEARFDLSDLDGFDASRVPREIAVELGENVTLKVIEQVEWPELVDEAGL